MKKIEKILILIIIMIMIFCVNYSFASEVTEENFYNTLINVNEGFSIETGASYAGSTSHTKIGISYTDYKLKKEANRITYIIPITEDNPEEIEVFYMDYTIDSNIFKCHSCLDANKFDEIENAEMYGTYALISYSQLNMATILTLANILDVAPENAFGYYIENYENNEDARNIFTSISTDENNYHESNLEVNLDNFSKINSTYLNGTNEYKIIFESEQITDNNQSDFENSNNENNLSNNNANMINQENGNTDINNNTNNNTNTNSNINSNTNLSQNTNKNNIDNSLSNKILPKTGIGRAGLVIIIISIIGIYCYKKYVDYNKIF